MAESNGSSEFTDRLRQLEASHIALMVDHELEVKRNDRAWRRHRRWLKEYAAQRKEDDARYEALRLAQIESGKDLDRRISELVSGIGKFISEKADKL